MTVAAILILCLLLGRLLSSPTETDRTVLELELARALLVGVFILQAAWTLAWIAGVQAWALSGAGLAAVVAAGTRLARRGGSGSPGFGRPARMAAALVTAAAGWLLVSSLPAMPFVELARWGPSVSGVLLGQPPDLRALAGPATLAPQLAAAALSLSHGDIHTHLVALTWLGWAVVAIGTAGAGVAHPERRSQRVWWLVMAGGAALTVAASTAMAGTWFAAAALVVAAAEPRGPGLPGYGGLTRAALVGVLATAAPGTWLVATALACAWAARTDRDRRPTPRSRWVPLAGLTPAVVVTAWALIGPGPGDPGGVSGAIHWLPPPAAGATLGGLVAGGVLVVGLALLIGRLPLLRRTHAALAALALISVTWLSSASFGLVPAALGAVAVVAPALLIATSRGGASAALDRTTTSETATVVYDSSLAVDPVDTELEGLVTYRHLVWAWTLRSLSLRYKRSVLGILWTVLEPLVLISILAVVFSSLFRFEIPNYAVYVLSGWLMWDFFSRATSMMAADVRATSEITSRFRLPWLVFPVSTTLAYLVNWVVALAVLAIVMAATGCAFTASLVALPAAMALVALFALGVGCLVTTLSSLFHDFGMLYSVLLTLWFYATPIIYPPSILPAYARPLLLANPMTHFLSLIRGPIYEQTVPDAATWFAAASLALTAATIGLWVFTRARSALMARG